MLLLLPENEIEMLRHLLADISIIDIAVSQLNFQVRCLVQQLQQRSALGENGVLK